MTGKPVYKAYTDGGAWPNNGKGRGGWGFILIDANGGEIEGSGGAVNTTNNRMEITAAIMALQALPEPSIVQLYSDSQYLVKALGGFVNGKRQGAWIDKWRALGWRRREGALENPDLWQTIDALRKVHQIEAHWIRGHAGNQYNERCDKLASKHINSAIEHVAEPPNEPIKDHPNTAGGGVLIIQYHSPEQRDFVMAAVQAAIDGYDLFIRERGES